MKEKIRKYIRKIINENFDGATETETVLNGMSNEQARNFVSKVAKTGYHSGLYKDEYWEGKSGIFKAFEKAGIDCDITGSEYYNWPPKNSAESSGKIWKVEFRFINKNKKETLLHGTIHAAGAGTMEDPLDKYDMNFTVFEETADVKQMYRNAGMEPPHPGKGVHTKKFHKCVTDVGKKGKVDNPQAICMASLGKEKAVKASHRTDESDNSHREKANYELDLNLLNFFQKLSDKNPQNEYLKSKLDKQKEEMKKYGNLY